MNQFSSFFPFILLLVVFYFVLIAPQRKRDKKMKAMLASLKVGDEILTIGGIFGKIVKIKDDILTIEVGADRTKLKIAKWSVREAINKVEDSKAKIEESSDTTEETENTENTEAK